MSEWQIGLHKHDCKVKVGSMYELDEHSPCGGPSMLMPNVSRLLQTLSGGAIECHPDAESAEGQQDAVRLAG